MILQTSWTNIQEEQAFYFNMLEMTQLKHFSRFMKPIFLPDTLIKRTANPQPFIQCNAESRFRQILGPVSTALEEKKPELAAVSETRVRLSSVISILDFEYAASQNLPPAAFACECWQSRHAWNLLNTFKFLNRAPKTNMRPNGTEIRGKRFVSVRVYSDQSTELTYRGIF